VTYLEHLMKLSLYAISLIKYHRNTAEIKYSSPAFYYTTP